MSRSTRNEVLALAREAGMLDRAAFNHSAELERFAELVAAKEREACADACDTTYYQFIGPEFGEVRYGIAACAKAIRARNT